jgi:hypothetical protein
MPLPPTVRQHRALSLSTLLLAAALAVPTTAVAQNESTGPVAASEGVAQQLKGESRQKRAAGPRARCRTFKNRVTIKRGDEPGIGEVKRNFGAGAGDKGPLVFNDDATGTGLFWTEEPGYLSAFIATLESELSDAELRGLLYEGAPGSIERQVLVDELAERAAVPGATSEQLFDGFEQAARELDGCLWTSRFVPRKADRERVGPFWNALVGEPGSDVSATPAGRFQVDLTWRDVAGEEQAETQSFDALDVAEGAPGFIFDVGGSELLVKLLDACSSNDHFWVFASSASDVAFELVVTDTASGESRVYANPQAVAPAITDTRAFATCP